jgi:hypothetical protein
MEALVLCSMKKRRVADAVPGVSERKKVTRENSSVSSSARCSTLFWRATSAGKGFPRTGIKAIQIWLPQHSEIICLRRPCGGKAPGNTIVDDHDNHRNETSIHNDDEEEEDPDVYMTTDEEGYSKTECQI